MENQKRCVKCKELKASKDFYKCKVKEDGLYSHCKECEKKYIQNLYENVEVLNIKEKECNMCKETKDVSEFNNWFYSKDKKSFYCKKCTRNINNKKIHCECGKIIQWSNYYKRHLRTKYHNSNV